MEKISSFTGKYSFLSNFSYENPYIIYDGERYSSVERAFQAAKVPENQKEIRVQFRVASSNAEAKKLGRQVPLRTDWEKVKISVMKDLLRQKFSIPKMKELLLSTGDSYLEEGNNHHDRFWGTVSGKGENHLGKLLMEVREEIKDEKIN